LLDRLRTRLDGSLLALGRSLASTGLSPAAWTWFGLLASLGAAAAYWSSAYSGQFAGGVLVLLGGLFDIADGAVARATGSSTKRGAFLDSTLDRLGEVAVYSGILLGGLASPLFTLLALSFSLLVSYTRAKGESLGLRLSGVGIGERSERLIILSVLSVAGLTSYGVLLVLLVAALTFLERVSKGSRALR